MTTNCSCVAQLVFHFEQISKTCHFDRNEPTPLPFRFLLRNRSVHEVENFPSSHVFCAKKPLFDFCATWIDPVK
jgi:hypothetical protein